jgi:hypothetical protein
MCPQGPPVGAATPLVFERDAAVLAALVEQRLAQVYHQVDLL